MTSRISRVLVAAVATTLAAGSLGCGLINQAKDIVGTAQVLSDFADRLGKASKLTYTAEYKTSSGDKVTMVQQPPNSAFLGKSGRFIFTADSMYLCSTEQKALTCQKSPIQGANAGAANAGLVAGVTGPGFITPELALGLIAAAAFVPGAKVEQSEKTIAGEDSLCATASGLEAAASPGDKDAPKDFSVCVTEAGILASFSGTSTTGEKVSIELTKYSTSADASAFEPPAGAKIVDVTQIQPSS
ncbi:MAG TPA: hypothetical protein VF163_05525 [Micromonosporaceae bacterium]